MCVKYNTEMEDFKVENRGLSFRDVIIKNINCVVEGVSTKSEALDEIMASVCMNDNVSKVLNSISVEEAIRLHNEYGITFRCKDGQVVYASSEAI